jgi:hypothetical protein
MESLTPMHLINGRSVCVWIVKSVLFLDGIWRNVAKRYNSETFLARVVPMVPCFFF